MEGLHIPVQYQAGPSLSASVVIHNTQEDKDSVEGMLQKLLGVKTGKLSFGPAGTAAESLAYNEGYSAGIAAVKSNTLIVHTPDLVDADTGDVLIRGVKKRKK
jgi:hypothetical protein